MSAAAQPSTFTGNLFCSSLTSASCHFGYTADCRMSAALYNHRMLLQVDKTTNLTLHRPSPMGGRPTGYIFNQHLVESSFGKCAYAFDGTTNNNRNGGCGATGGVKCPGAYNYICPSTGKRCTASDKEVKQQMCKTDAQPDGEHKVPFDGMSNQCFWKGPALGYPASGEDHLRMMVDFRIKNQEGSDREGGHGRKISQWNEVIIDERVLIPAIEKDPANVIWAFVYDASQSVSKKLARQMQEEFCSAYNCKTKPPLIAMHTEQDFTNSEGPFSYEADADVHVVV